MVYDIQLANTVRQELEKQLGPELFEDEVIEKKMFGGLAFMVRGHLCLAISGRKDVCLMVRVGKENHDDLLTKRDASTIVMRGRLYKGYLGLDAEGVKELPFWIEQSLAFNEELTGS